MLKVFVIICFLLITGNANAVAVKDCNVGADSWWRGLGNAGARPAPPVSIRWVLDGPLEVESLNGKGKPSGRCRLVAGEVIIVPFSFDPAVRHSFSSHEDKMKLAFIARCGNPIVSLFRFTVPKVNNQPAVAPATPFGGQEPAPLELVSQNRAPSSVAMESSLPVAVVAEKELPSATVGETSSVKKRAKPLLSGVDENLGGPKVSFIPQDEESEVVVVHRPRRSVWDNIRLWGRSSAYSTSSVQTGVIQGGSFTPPTLNYTPPPRTSTVTSTPVTYGVYPTTTVATGPVSPAP
ncbi:MAG: hypothetical protein HZB10_02035 [Candidatus Yonathbacteria bacterium]|nr:hypothetical protein [Candidatus Yonathbacteria bacterium]